MLYLQTYNLQTGNSGGSISTLSTGSSSLIQSPDSYATPLSRSGGGFSQSTSSPSSVEVSSDVVTMSNGTSPLSLIEGTDNFEIDVALRRIEEQLSLGEENLKDLSLYYSENEISNDSGFSIDDQDYGDVSITNNQQTLIWDDVIEYGGNPVEEKGANNNRKSSILSIMFLFLYRHRALNM